MRILNGQKFYEEPTSCGTCPFFYNGTTYTPISDRGSTTGHCTMFDERHKVWRSVPNRCQKIFRKLFSLPDGDEYVITRRSS